MPKSSHCNAFFYKTVLKELEITEVLWKQSHVLLNFHHNKNIPLKDTNLAQGFYGSLKTTGYFKTEVILSIRILPR